MTEVAESDEAFRPVEIGDLDEKLAKLAETKSIPTMRPSGIVTSKIQPARTPGKPMTVDVPDYLRVALKVKAAHMGVSVRYLILSALLETGYEIKPVDMDEDGRRWR